MRKVWVCGNKLGHWLCHDYVFVWGRLELETPGLIQCSSWVVMSKKLYATLCVLSLFPLNASFLCYCWETCAPTWLNVIPDNADMFITVRPRVFVPESDHVTQLMHHNAKLVTVFPNGYGLGASSSTTHVGAAPAAHKQRGRFDKIEWLDFQGREDCRRSHVCQGKRKK